MAQLMGSNSGSGKFTPLGGSFERLLKSPYVTNSTSTRRVPLGFDYFEMFASRVSVQIPQTLAFGALHYPDCIPKADRQRRQIKYLQYFFGLSRAV